MTGLLREGRRVFNERLKDEYQSKDDALDVQLLDSSVVDAIKGNGGCFVVKKIGDIWLETISKFRGRNQSEDSTKDLDVLGQSVHGLAELFLKCQCGDAVTVTNKIRKTIKTLEDSGTDNGHNKVMGETDVWFDLLEEAINAV